MKILLVSPLGFPVNELTRYSGIEVLVFNYAKELSKNHQVTVLGHAESKFPPAVRLLPTQTTGQDIYAMEEMVQYQTYQSELRKHDVIHDFSHQHFASKCIPNLPSLNIFWHAPNEVQYPKAPYNIVGLSKWACRMFKQYYHQEARFQQSIALDTTLYKPGGERGDRFLTLGIMDTQKGNWETAKLCKEMGVPLDIVGKPYNPEYVKEVEKFCDGQNIRYLGEVSDVEKIHLMQTCKALIYHLPVPEVTSHKIQEAMLCGAPIIAGRLGALPEIITHGVDGILCGTEQEYKDAVLNVGSLVPRFTYEKIRETYSVETVCKNYEPLYQKVAGGLRW